MLIKKTKRLPFVIITLLLLASCFTTPFEMNYNESPHVINITEEYDVSQKGVVRDIFDKFKTEPLSNLFDQNAIFFSQLYYLSFSSEFDVYGTSYSDGDFPLFSSSNRDFLLSPIKIYTFNYQNDDYFVIYSEKSIYDDYDERYRSTVEVFQLNQRTFIQIDDFFEHFSINGRGTNEWSALNDLFKGEVSPIFLYLDELSFLTNEIILSLAFSYYDYELFTNFRLISRFLSVSSLGVRYDTEEKTLIYDRQIERECYPSFSNCQDIYVLDDEYYIFDFENLVYIYGNNYSDWSEIEFDLNYNLNFNFSKELLDDLLEQKTAQAFSDSLNQIYTQYSFSLRDEIKLFFLNF
jgi:hypothetical protein